MKQFKYLFTSLCALTILCAALLAPVITHSARPDPFAEFRIRQLGRTAALRLIKAVEEGNVFEARQAISDGADVNTIGSSPGAELLLSLAARANNYPMVQLLLDKKADPNRANHGVAIYGSPLIIAMDNKNITMIRALVDAGADVNFESRYGGTVLLRAVVSGIPEIVALVLNKGARVSEDEGTDALYRAVQSDNEQIVKMLLDVGVNACAKDNDLQKYFKEVRNPKIRKLLQDAIDREFFNGMMKEKSDVKAVRNALDCGADIKWANIPYIAGMSPFLFAVERNNIALVKMLLAAGANPRDTSKYYGSALDTAKTPEMKKMLEDAIAASPVAGTGIKRAVAAVVGGEDLPPAYQAPEGGAPPSYEESLRLARLEQRQSVARPSQAGPAQEEEKKREAAEIKTACEVCTFENKPGSKTCEICTAPLPVQSPGVQGIGVQSGGMVEAGQEQRSAGIVGGGITGFGNTGALQEQGPAIGAAAVACQVCTYQNPKHREKCEMCETVLPKRDIPVGPPGGLRFR